MTGRISAHLCGRFTAFTALPLVLAAALLVSMPSETAAEDKKTNLSREAKLYRVPTGDVYTAKYELDRKGKGTVQVDLSAPQVLTGEYVPVKPGDPRWGHLFRALGGTIDTKGFQRGTMSAEGGGLTIQCEYITTASREGGFGFCKDSRDAQYRFQF